MLRILLALAMLLPAVASAGPLPRVFGKLQFGMPEAQVTNVSGADFSSWCASCPPDGDETNIKPEYFVWFTDVFPGLSPSKWMPNDAIVLLTTKGKLSGIVLGPEQKGVEILSILRKRLGEPTKTDTEGTTEWKDESTIIQCDINTVRIYNRKAFPHL